MIVGQQFWWIKGVVVFQCVFVQYVGVEVVDGEDGCQVDFVGGYLQVVFQCGGVFGVVLQMVLQYFVGQLYVWCFVFDWFQIDQVCGQCQVFVDVFVQFLGSCIGEGYCQDLFDVQVLFYYQVGKQCGQGEGFVGIGVGFDQVDVFQWQGQIGIVVEGFEVVFGDGGVYVLFFWCVLVLRVWFLCIVLKISWLLCSRLVQLVLVVNGLVLCSSSCQVLLLDLFQLWLLLCYCFQFLLCCFFVGVLYSIQLVYGVKCSGLCRLCWCNCSSVCSVVCVVGMFSVGSICGLGLVLLLLWNCIRGSVLLVVLVSSQFRFWWIIVLLLSVLVCSCIRFLGC